VILAALAAVSLLDALPLAAAALTLEREQQAERAAASASREFRGGNLEALTAPDRELVVSGPAGTGKSVALLERIHRSAEAYPGSRQLVLRKTRTSLTQSALVTFEEKVVPEGHPVLLGASGRRLERSNRSAYSYPNGATVVVGGMDEPTRLFSAEYDAIYCQEMTELSRDEWQSLLRALRNNRMPTQQLMGDCNPQHPEHWARKRSLPDGETPAALRMLETTHKDNPALWNGTDWTPYGANYIAGLKSLTGVLYERLYEGRWVAAEGVVYADFRRASHIVPRFEIPETWSYYAAVDFGYTNPFVWQLWAKDPDGRLYLVREIYRTQRLVEDHAREINTAAAFKSITPGIEAVQARLRAAGDGKPRLFVLEGALTDRDEALANAHKPTCTVEEFEVYAHPKGLDGKPVKEEPVKMHDHGMDAIRYLVCAVDGITNAKGAAWLQMQDEWAAKRAGA
jgi:PBSX family phage terminase large subunit